MKTVDVFASRVLGPTVSDSRQSILPEITANHELNETIEFALTAVFQAEIANESATVTVSIVSPKGAELPIFDKEAIVMEETKETVALGRSVRVEFKSQGYGLYGYRTRINGIVNESGLLFELKHSSQVPISIRQKEPV